MKIESHDNNIVKKPWGYEYLVYQNEKVALWYLFIAPGQSTSFHAHPNKTTGLIILDGKAEVKFFSDKHKVDKLDKVMIRKGFFHSTTSLSDSGTSLFEIETPNDKHDLVRLEDFYGRVGKPYENSDFEYPKKTDCLSIDVLENKKLSFANCELQIKNLNSINDLTELDDEDNVMFLSGGVFTDYNTLVISPADIVKVKILKTILNVFNNIQENTYVMIFSKNG